MARIEGDEVQTRLCEVFGIKPEQITPQQIFLLVKIIKHCRLRCRSNVALHNWLKRAFPDLNISTVKMKSKYDDGTYDALKVFNPLQAGGVGGTEEEDKE